MWVLRHSPCSQNNMKSSFWNLSVTCSTLCFHSPRVPFLSLPCSAFRLLPCGHREVSELASPGPPLSFRVSLLPLLLIEAQQDVAPVLRRLREKHLESFPLDMGWPLQPLPTAVSNPRFGATGPVAWWPGPGLQTTPLAPVCCPEDGARGRGCPAEPWCPVLFLGLQQVR